MASPGPRGAPPPTVRPARQPPRPQVLLGSGRPAPAPAIRPGLRTPPSARRSPARSCGRTEVGEGRERLGPALPGPPASSPASPFPAGRHELTSAPPGNAAEGGPPPRGSGPSRPPGPQPWSEERGAGRAQAARAPGALPPPGGPAEESRQPGRGRQSPGSAPEGAREDPPGKGARTGPGRKCASCAGTEPHLHPPRLNPNNSPPSLRWSPSPQGTASSSSLGDFSSLQPAPSCSLTLWIFNLRTVCPCL